MAKKELKARMAKKELKVLLDIQVKRENRVSEELMERLVL
jgi:hypothetical protein